MTSFKSSAASIWRRPDPLVHHFEGRARDLMKPARLYDARFLREVDADVSRAAAGWLGSRGVSLGQALQSRMRTAAQPTASGFETVDVPYPHVVAIFTTQSHDPSQQDVDMAREAQDGAANAMDRAWWRYVDPLLKCRARVFNRPGASGEDICRVYFGEGVFAPMEDEPPIGEVVVRGRPDGRASTPLLPGGVAAGLYKAQSRLAFSGDWLRTPAVCDGLVDLPGAFSLAPRRLGQTRATASLEDCELRFHRLGRLGRDVAQPGVKPLPPPANGGPGPDAAFAVDFPHVVGAGAYVTDFTVEVTFDKRPSRLHARRPRELALAVLGVVEPRGLGAPAPRRWWIDLAWWSDRNRKPEARLCFSAMIEPEKSVVGREGGYEAWDWSRPARRGRPESAGVQRGRVTIEGETCEALVAARPLGWIIPPEGPRVPAFTPSAHEDEFALDWLDWAGAVETAEGVARLGDWLGGGPKAALMPGRATGGAGGEEFMHACARSEGWNFKAVPPIAVRPGMRFLVGGLMLECVDAAAAGGA